MKRFTLMLFVAAVAVAGDPPKKNEKLFKGDVAGPAGAGAELASGWAWTLDADNFGAKDPLAADAKGHFEKSLPWKDKQTWFAADKAHKMGAGMEIKEGELAKGVTFRLQPLVKVKMNVKSKIEGFATAGIVVGVKLEGAERIGAGHVGESGLVLLLPPGEYKLKFEHEGWQPRDVKLSVSPGKPEVAAPDVEVTPSLLASKTGEVMPEWHIVDAIGAAKDVKMASFRGKWLLMEFWRHGCPSCRGWGIPNLVKFTEKHAAWKDRLQVVAFHNKDASSASDLAAKLKNNADLTWNVMALPFPVVIDAPEPSTVEEWGTGEFPYGVLLDKDGKLVAKGTLEDLEKRLLQEWPEKK